MNFDNFICNHKEKLRFKDQKDGKTQIKNIEIDLG